MSMLKVENLTTVVGSGASAPSVLEDVSFTLDAGEVLCVVGESGSGKSMLALTIMGLLGFPARRAKGRIIRRLIDRHRPTRAVEIGSLLGYSAILIAGELPPRGRLTCIEANPYLARFVKANATEAGLGGKVKVIVGDALRARGVDVVFTRTTDTLIALDDRGRIANQSRALVFISIHVNAANPHWRDPSAARGFAQSRTTFARSFGATFA